MSILYEIIFTFVVLFVIVLIVLKIYIKSTTGINRTNTCLIGKTVIITGGNSGKSKIEIFQEFQIF